jgi:hypothetical protein
MSARTYSVFDDQYSDRVSGELVQDTLKQDGTRVRFNLIYGDRAALGDSRKTTDGSVEDDIST